MRPTRAQLDTQFSRSRTIDARSAARMWSHIQSKHVLSAVLVLAVLPAGQGVRAAEYIRAQTPIPASVEELQTALDVSLEKEERVVEKVVFDGLKRRLRTKSAWLRDLSFDFNLRSYYYKRVNRTEAINEALALGGELALVTGRFANFARLGLSYYGSLGLDAPEDRGGSPLLGPDQEDLGVLGQAYLELGTLEKIGALLYRQILELPYLNKLDIGMIPITHEAYLIGRRGTGRDFGIGHITKIKRREAERFVSMSEAAGAPGTDKGVTMAGVKLDLGQNRNLGLFNNYGWDTYNTAYAEASWIGPLARRSNFRVSAQFTDQRSVGDALVGDFDTNAFGIAMAADRRGMVFKLSYTQTDKGGAIRNPWGGSPSYNSMMLENFSRAGEKSMRFGFSWTGRGNRDAWSGFVNLVKGWDAIDADTGIGLPDVTEYDFTADYRPQWGSSKGLWLRLRGAYADFEEGRNRWNVRVILNYPFNLL